MPATAISLVLAAAGVTLLLLLSFRYGFADVPRLEGDAEAAAIASGLNGGFEVKCCIMDRDRHGALLFDGAGKGVVIMPHGAHFIARLLSDEAHLSREGHWLTIQDMGWKAKLSIASDRDLGKIYDRFGI
jgi:hypothetical protein